MMYRAHYFAMRVYCDRTGKQVCRHFAPSCQLIATNQYRASLIGDFWPEQDREHNRVLIDKLASRRAIAFSKPSMLKHTAI